jgi:hypothetical protein
MFICKKVLSFWDELASKTAEDLVDPIVPNEIFPEHFKRTQPNFVC